MLYRLDLHSFKQLFFVSIIAILSHSIQAQNSSEIENLKLNSKISEESSYMAYSYQNAGEIGSFAGILFRFYKRFISSQDFGSCSFKPSCSEYAIIAIRKQGAITGMINTLDRLSRCHGKNNPFYEIDPKTELLIDEVRNLNYEKE